jgi:hypothetical protein
MLFPLYGVNRPATLKNTISVLRKWGGLSRSSKNKIAYPSIPSAMKPVSQGEDLPPAQKVTGRNCMFVMMKKKTVRKARQHLPIHVILNRVAMNHAK